ncbi:MAG: hypothetical protein IJJ33_02225 [Victivallales bacterium]|nr:hypothetical protein [Victivallales bacterium]
MSTLIETNKIDGFSIYGVQMVDYTLDGVAGKDFGTATALACFASSAAIEAETTAYADILRARQQKLKELADANEAIRNFIDKLPTKDPESDDEISWFTDSSEHGDYISWASTIKTVTSRYGLSCPVKTKEMPLPFGRVLYIDSVRRDDLENARAKVEYAMDVEDNDLQQDMIAMQGLIGKRDNSFTTAAKIIKKVGGTGDSMLRNIGQ